MWNKYFFPETAVEAAKILATNSQRAKIIAGGTDIVLDIKESKKSEIDWLVDITRIKGLNEISLDTDGFLHVGALVTHTACSLSPLIRKYALPLAQASAKVGGPQIRNRGTIGGNLITAMTNNDTITPLIALDARLKLISADGSERLIPIDGFYIGSKQTTKRTDEILTEIIIPARKENQKSAYTKFALRKSQAVAVVNTALLLEFDADIICHARVALSQVAKTVIRIAAIENYLIGKTLLDFDPEALGELVENSVTPSANVRGSAEFHKPIAGWCVCNAMEQMQTGKYDFDSAVRIPYIAETCTRSGLPKEYSADSIIHCTLNGKPAQVRIGENKTLLELIRDGFGLTGSKDGCSAGECGACTVILNGNTVTGCLVSAESADGADIRTVEGLADVEKLSTIQQAFVDEGAVQCGYCIPGFLMSATHLLENVENPTLAEIKCSISGNLCRCTGYYKIIKAIEAAAK